MPPRSIGAGCLANSNRPWKLTWGHATGLDFSRSGGVGGGVHEAGEEVAWGEGGVDRIGVSAAIPGGPEGAADGGQGVGEGGVVLGVPGGGADGQPVGVEGVGDTRARVPGHDAEEAEQDTQGVPGGALGGEQAPAPLRLGPQPGAQLLEGDLHVPPRQVPGQHLERAGGGVGAARDERPAHWQRRPAGAVLPARSVATLPLHQATRWPNQAVPA